MPDPIPVPIAPIAEAGTAARCDRCSASSATVTTPGNGVVCEDCASRYYLRCRGCHLHYPADADCPHCITCDRCDAAVREGHAVDTARGSRICERCRDRYYWQCAVCDGWNPDGYDCGNGCCDPDGCDCDDCRSDGLDGLVHDYGYKPAPVFHGTGPLFLGAELELEIPYERTDECIGIAQSHLGSLGYLKADGSLLHGFEIVTHPMSYPWAMANFPWQMLVELARCGAEVSDHTGLHVHVSRAGFTCPCHAFRWMKFVYRNQSQVETLARRSGTSWAAFTADDRRAVKQYAKGACSARYRAINTGNRDTFELRMFASSLEPTEVQAALGFASASIEYTGQLTVPAIAHGGWNWPAFAGWLADRPAYTPLHRQLEDLACVC